MIGKLAGENEIMKLDGTVKVNWFKKVKIQVILTNKRVYKLITEGFQKQSTIIPLANVDSFGVETSQQIYLLGIGLLACLFGLITMFSSDKGVGFLILIVGGVFIAAWWFSRRIGAVVYSVSGKSEIFINASAENESEISKFIVNIQEAVEAIKK